MFMIILLFVFIQFASGDDLSRDQRAEYTKNDSKNTAFGEVSGSIPPTEKNGVYYFVITTFVLSTFVSTVLSGAFLALSIVFWSHFKQMKFFWFLTQLTISVFIMSSLNLLINVPATLFSLITTDFVQSDAFYFMSNVIDFCHNAVLFSNLMIAVQRFFVFFVRKHSERLFEKPLIYIWLSLVWILSAISVISMASNNCRYEYKVEKRNYVLMCTSDSKKVIDPSETIQMVSSIVFLLCQTIHFEITAAFLFKRVINTAEIIAGAATPCFFFFTSKDVRKLVTVKVSVTSSQANSNNQQRRQTLRST